MSILTINTEAGSSSPFYVQRTDLDGVEYVLSFEYSGREDAWYLSVSDQEEVLLATVKIVCGASLLGRLVSDNRPAGRLFCLPLTADNNSPGLDDLAPDTGRCVLVYETAAA